MNDNICAVGNQQLLPFTSDKGWKATDTVFQLAGLETDCKHWSGDECGDKGCKGREPLIEGLRRKCRPLAWVDYKREKTKTCPKCQGRGWLPVGEDTALRVVLDWWMYPDHTQRVENYLTFPYRQIEFTFTDDPESDGWVIDTPHVRLYENGLVVTEHSGVNHIEALFAAVLRLPKVKEAS